LVLGTSGDWETLTEHTPMMRSRDISAGLLSTAKRGKFSTLYHTV
jgi:hypothetical protein